MAEKILNSYETIFIIDATLDEETVTALKDKFTTLIEQNGELVLNATVDDIRSEQKKSVDALFREVFKC